MGNLEEGPSTRDFKRWMNGALGMALLSLKKSVEGGPQGGGVPSLGTLENILRKALDVGISLYRGSFMNEGNLESGGGPIYWGLRKMNEGGL